MSAGKNHVIQTFVFRHGKETLEVFSKGARNRHDRELSLAKVLAVEVKRMLQGRVEE
jgi:hypothetical protein